MESRLLELSNRNLAGAVSHFARHAEGTIEPDGSCVLVASAPPYDGPLFNAAIRTNRETSAAIVISRAQRFFAANPREYTLWAAQHADEDLVEAARLAGLTRDTTGEAPGMALRTPLGPPTIPSNVDLARVSSHETASAFGSVAAEVFKSFGSPADAANNLARRPGMVLNPNVAAFIAYLDGKLSSCGMVVTTGDVAGIYFIGTVESARSRGLGEVMTRMTAHAGFELGARTIVLQSTLMAAPLYRRIGFIDFNCYVNYTGNAVSGGSSLRLI